MSQLSSYGDNPIRHASDDLLGRSDAIQAISGVLLDPRIDTPLTIGIFGDWGTGKTSFMRLLREALPAGHLSVWLDAWRYTNQESALWRALLVAVIDGLREQADALLPDDAGERAAFRTELDHAEMSLYRSFEYETAGKLNFNWRAALPLALEAGLSFVPAGKSVYDSLRSWLADDGAKITSLIEREKAISYKQQLTSLDQFQNTFRSLLGRYLRAADGGTGRPLLVIFVDDLDRCLPGAALGALEALKVFLDAPGCAFVLGMDRRLIARGIAERLGDGAPRRTDPSPVLDPGEYLEKIIQLPFTLPAPGPGQIERLIDAHFSDVDPMLRDACRPLIMAGVASNPRKVRRTLNVLRLTLALHRVTAPSAVQLITKLVVLQTCYDPVFRRVQTAPSSIRALEAACWRAAPGTADGADLERHARLRDMLLSGVQFSTVTDAELRPLFSAVLRSYAPAE